MLMKLVMAYIPTYEPVILSQIDSG